MASHARPSAPTAVGLPALLAFLAVFAAARPATAQISPSDSAAVLLDAAESLERQGRADAADAVLRLLMERFPDTSAAVAARARLDSLARARAEGSGAVELTVWMTLYGAGLGVAVPGAFGSDQTEAYGIGLLVGAPAGFLAGRQLARALDLTEGQARAITLGGTWGAWQGYGWQEVFDVGVRQSCSSFGGGEFCYDAEDDVEETFASMIVGSLLGMTTGAILSGRDISAGAGTTINFGALWGTWFGVATGVLADLDDDALLAATLIGGDVGLVGSALASPRWGLSRNRARLISLSGVLGGLAGAGIDLIATPDDDKVAIGIPFATSVAGLLIGAVATRAATDRAGDDSGAELGGSLLRWTDGRLAFGVPLPTPSWSTTDTPAGARTRPTLRVEWLHASF